MATRVLKAALIVVSAIAALLASAELELFERFAIATVRHETWQLDEVFSMLMLAALYLPVQIVISARRLRRARREAREIARKVDDARRRDPLTGLINRQSMQTAQDRRRHSDALPPTVLTIALSGFRAINEYHDHRVADQVLMEVASRIVDTCDKTDLPARIGGAEFAIMLGPQRHQKSAERLAKALTQRIAQPINIGVKTLWVRANIGVAPGADRAEHDDALLCADRALQMAKADGPGQFRVFDSAARAQALRDEKVRETLKVSLENDEVEPVFQPIVNLKTRRIEGVEVLARWPRCHQKISPFEYILAAERDGSISLLTDLILAKACKTLATLDEDIWMSFNLSAQEFVDPGLPVRILSTLSLYGIETHRFLVEITETSVMADLDTAQRVITAFRDAGVKIALDDFGTGASSLTLLARLPLDRMKIDQSFVGHIEISKSNAQIVTSMLVLARGLGLSVVVEGVERPEEHDFLVERGCPYGQGYLYGRPCPADKIAHRLAMGPDYLRLLDKAG